jgi:transcriptional regulator with XRE-family HTH domain
MGGSRMPDVEPVEPEALRARVAARIRELAKRRKLRLIDLADQTGGSRGYLWTVLRGESAATLDYLCRLARVLQVDPLELVRPPPKPKSPT